MDGKVGEVRLNENLIEIGKFIHKSLLNGSSKTNPAFDEAILYFVCNSLTILKEQEPILLENQHKPYGISTNANSPWISRCPICGKKVEGKQTKFCKYCGQAVKWDA